MSDREQALQRLQNALARTKAHEADPPARMRLRFGVYVGEGYVRGDAPRVELCCALYNERALLEELVRAALSAPAGDKEQ